MSVLRDCWDQETGEKQREEKKGYSRNRYDGTFLSRNHIDTKCKLIIILCLIGIMYILYNATIKAKNPLHAFYNVLNGNALFGSGNSVENIGVSDSNVFASPKGQDDGVNVGSKR